MRQSFTLECSTVLVDLDGVLVNSMPAIRTALAAWAARRGLPVHQVLGLAHGRRTVDIVRTMVPERDEDTEVGLITELEIDSCRRVLPVAGADRFVDALAGRPWAIVTSGLREISLLKLKAAGLRTPDVIVSAEDVTASKPAPECYLRAARTMNTPTADCVVFEDAPAGFASARAAGIRCIGVGPTAAHYSGELSARIHDFTGLRMSGTQDERRLRLSGGVSIPSRRGKK
ncbi:hypothetical protein AWN90_04490 [Nocardia terpenica]|uniref:HAD-IA family hydrolase n=1 Tax=Nocardia terpenica TaxID=455432 RepID=A0A164IYU4_9NOCA|nr:hypothetical protein AWN90_04490 [Nocardia terpenica]